MKEFFSNTFEPFIYLVIKWYHLNEHIAHWYTVHSTFVKLQPRASDIKFKAFHWTFSFHGLNVQDTISELLRPRTEADKDKNVHNLTRCDRKERICPRSTYLGRLRPRHDSRDDSDDGTDETVGLATHLLQHKQTHHVSIPDTLIHHLVTIRRNYSSYYLHCAVKSSSNIIHYLLRNNIMRYHQMLTIMVIVDDFKEILFLKFYYTIFLFGAVSQNYSITQFLSIDLCQRQITDISLTVILVRIVTNVSNIPSTTKISCSAALLSHSSIDSIAPEI